MGKPCIKCCIIFPSKVKTLVDPLEYNNNNNKDKTFLLLVGVAYMDQMTPLHAIRNHV